MSQDGPRTPEPGGVAADHRRSAAPAGADDRDGRRDRQEFRGRRRRGQSIVRFDCTSKFKRRPFRNAHYASVAARRKRLATAKQLFKANAAQLPRDNKRLPKIVCASPTALASSVVTTDFFGFDTSDNHYHLQGLGDVSEMGDAVLGSWPVRWSDRSALARCPHVSDPQIKAAGLTLRQQATLAAQIYKAFGRWSSVCSAIVCWALIVAG